MLVLCELIKMKFFLIFLVTFKLVTSANILVFFQLGTFSHNLMYNKLMEGLLANGHNLTIFTSYEHKFSQNDNVTQHIFTETTETLNDGANMMNYKQQNLSLLRFFIFYDFPRQWLATDLQLQHPEVQKIFKNKENYKFDLLMIECLLCSIAHLADLYDIPIVYLLANDFSSVFHKVLGNGVNPLVFSELAHPFTHGKLSITEMLHSMNFYAAISTAGQWFCEWTNDLMTSKHLKNIRRKSMKI